MHSMTPSLRPIRSIPAAALFAAAFAACTPAPAVQAAPSNAAATTTAPIAVPAGAPVAAPVAAAAPANAGAAAATPRAPAPCWSFAPGVVDAAGWHAIRDGVTVTRAADGSTMDVSYHRDRGKPAGIAFELAPKSSERLGTIVLRMAAAAEQRLSVCLTDGNGVVWTFPTLKATTTMQEFHFAAKEVRPDPFQNAGKRVPERPDCSDLRMLTILDIGGFLGAAAVDCTWRIESLRGEEGER